MRPIGLLKKAIYALTFCLTNVLLFYLVLDNNEKASLFAHLMSSRAELVSHYCQHLKENPSERFTYNFKNLFYLRERSLLWCPVFKAASSTWMVNFFALANKTKSEREQILADHKNSYPVDLANLVITPILDQKSYSSIRTNDEEAEQQQLRSFIIVRHPFHRLVSAFRDKVERLHGTKLKKDYYYNLLGREIVDTYRVSAVKRFGEYMLSKANNFGAVLPVYPRKRRVPELPTFWEFVQFVIDTPPENHNEHWAAAYRHCSVCMVRYEAVVKFENLDHEGPLLEKFLRVDGMVPRYMGGTNKVNEYKKDPEMSEEEITRRYLETLSDLEVEMLYEVFKQEFKMFGYTYTFRNVTYPKM